MRGPTDAVKPPYPAPGAGVLTCRHGGRPADSGGSTTRWVVAAVTFVVADDGGRLPLGAGRPDRAARAGVRLVARARSAAPSRSTCSSSASARRSRRRIVRALRRPPRDVVALCQVAVGAGLSTLMIASPGSSTCCGASSIGSATGALGGAARGDHRDSLVRRRGAGLVSGHADRGERERPARVPAAARAGSSTALRLALDRAGVVVVAAASLVLPLAIALPARLARPRSALHALRRRPRPTPPPPRAANPFRNAAIDAGRVSRAGATSGCSRARSSSAARPPTA